MGFLLRGETWLIANDLFFLKGQDALNSMVSFWEIKHYEKKEVNGSQSDSLAMF